MSLSASPRSVCIRLPQIAEFHQSSVSHLIEELGVVGEEYHRHPG